MRRIPTSLIRHARRRPPSPSPRSFVTSVQRLQASHSDMSSVVTASSKLHQASQPPKDITGFEPSAETVEEKEAHFAQTAKRKKRNPTLEFIQPATLEMSNSTLSIASPDMDPLLFSFVYLRDLCKCPRCVDPHSKQRSFRTSDINKHIQPNHIRWDGKYLEIAWDDRTDFTTNHVSRWHYTYLQHHPINTHHTAGKVNGPMLWNAERMQKVQHWVSYDDYMNNNEQFTVAMRNLQRSGLIFVKDIPDSREMVEKIATRMGPLRNTFYGMTWDVRTVPQAKNVAYTNQFLGFHMDLMYMNEPPGYQLLHCIENSCDGGESLFADAFWAAKMMKERNPEQYNILTKFHLAYEYVHNDQIYYNRRPVFEVDPHTQRLNYVNYSPPFQSAIPPQSKDLDEWVTDKSVRPTERSKVMDPDTFGRFKGALKHFAHLVEQPANYFQLKLNPGECVIFNNRRTLHARRQFDTTSGSRWLAGAYVDTDAVNSRFHVCNKNNPALWHTSNPYHWLNPAPEVMGGTDSTTQAIKAAYTMADDMAKEAKRFEEDEGIEKHKS